MVKLPTRIFFTGVPGSRWSGIAQQLELVLGLNTSDRTPEREYTHSSYSGHKGVYFGKGMEFPADLKNVDRGFTSLHGCRLIKSHEWSYMIKDIHSKFIHDWILLVYRDNNVSFSWWKDAGGFDIKYPNYSYYKDDDTMLKEIRSQNKHILDFSVKHKLKWDNFGSKFIQNNFDVSANIETMKDVYVTLIK